MKPITHYVNVPRVMDHNGTTTTIWHCGRCLGIIPFDGADCEDCHRTQHKQIESLNRLKTQLNTPTRKTKKGGPRR